MNNKIEYDKIKYFKSENKTPISFNSFNLPLDLTRKKKDRYLDLGKSKKKKKKKKNQEKFISNLI